MSYQLSYFVYSLIFLGAWIVLFALRPDLRRDMLLFSLVIAPLGPASEIWFLRDYWQRPTITGQPISIEDAVFAFAIGGIAFSLYKTLFRLTSVAGPAQPQRVWLIAACSVINFSSLLLLTGWLRVNSIFSSSLAFVVCTLVIWRLRPDLIRPSLASGLLSLILFMAVYQLMRILFPGALARWCTGCNPSGVMILGVSLEEMLWDFTWGLFGGVVCEAVLGRALLRRG
jgi:predicted neutral ceramidase superfamily lipid hydrolase